ncbi:hypothetical protein C5C31_05130 [Rathayibacter rathayi]|uniref:hypothetical protein n=1 Tax=Rathayibacter rathayi TaxID=33887 RepID=UPI000CE7E139|nr:hypothetical protein [Rathayibacter rathayi]PPG70555.1 hypothetical protein C5C02_04355 [Rathayibacter rathayi]PPG76722.1 hypothetical protein C5C23_07105 [Rathayibacter rathayi]PPH25224.1 hypothetical protein C5C31_05130 [Rathayibacter rathayi]PPI77704.1 hypothetical protein C5E03_03120 [Rathayibacter rathayi]
MTRLRLVTVGGYLLGLILFSVTAAAGLDPLLAALVLALFLTSALLEFAALPLLGRLSTARGSAVALVVIALFGIASFSLLPTASSYPSCCWRRCSTPWWASVSRAPAWSCSAARVGAESVRARARTRR